METTIEQIVASRRYWLEITRKGEYDPFFREFIDYHAAADYAAKAASGNTQKIIVWAGTDEEHRAEFIDWFPHRLQQNYTTDEVYPDYDLRYILAAMKGSASEAPANE